MLTLTGLPLKIRNILKLIWFYDCFKFYCSQGNWHWHGITPWLSWSFRYLTAYCSIGLKQSCNQVRKVFRCGGISADGVFHDELPTTFFIVSDNNESHLLGILSCCLMTLTLQTRAAVLGPFFSRKSNKIVSIVTTLNQSLWFVKEIDVYITIESYVLFS